MYVCYFGEFGYAVFAYNELNIYHKVLTSARYGFSEIKCDNAYHELVVLEILLLFNATSCVKAVRIVHEATLYFVSIAIDI